MSDTTPRQSLIIATRKSPLALWQAEHVKALLEQAHPTLTVSLLAMSTKGDKILDTPLAKIGGKGLFVKELESSMLVGDADIAVHSMKDVPMDLPEGLSLNTYIEREQVEDAFVSNQFKSIDELPEGAVVGTSSLRRQAQIRALRPDLKLADCRGNVGTRLAKLDAGDYHAIILASAGLIRLGQAQRIACLISVDQVLPAAGQGAIGIEQRTDDDRITALLEVLNHQSTAQTVIAERALNKALDGGCQIPIGARSTLANGQITLTGMVAEVDGSKLLFATSSAPAEQAEQLGQEVAEQLIAQGAKIILDKLKA